MIPTPNVIEFQKRRHPDTCLFTTYTENVFLMKESLFIGVWFCRWFAYVCAKSLFHTEKKENEQTFPIRTNKKHWNSFVPIMSECWMYRKIWNCIRRLYRKLFHIFTFSIPTCNSMSYSTQYPDFSFFLNKNSIADRKLYGLHNGDSHSKSTCWLLSNLLIKVGFPDYSFVWWT